MFDEPIKRIHVPIINDKKSEKIEHPSHYNSLGAKCSKCNHAIECMDVVAAIGDFHLGNVIKYIWRHEHKNGIEDLKKAQYYLNDYIGRHGNE